MKDVLERYAAKTRTSLSIVAVIVMILAGLSACAQDNTTTTTPTFSNQTPIPIGTSLSSSKDFAQNGQSMEQGYRLWAKTINNNGGLLGRPVLLVIIHDNHHAAQFAANYGSLICKRV